MNQTGQISPFHRFEERAGLRISSEIKRTGLLQGFGKEQRGRGRGARFGRIALGALISAAATALAASSQAPHGTRRKAPLRF